MRRRTPPRRLESLLERRLGAGISGQGAVGDLAEAYQRMRSRRPGWVCDLWYAWQAATLLAYGAGFGGARAGASGPAGGPSADLRWALRLALRRPLFSLGVALTLGLGVGTTTAVFSVAHGTFRATSWWEEPERVMALWPGRPFSRGELSFLEEETGATFEAVGAYKVESFAVAVAGGESRSLEGARVSPSLFGRLAAQPALGRPLGAEDAVPGAEPTVVLSHRFWRESLGADPGVLGTRLEVNGELRTVVGVQGPGGTAPGSASDVWIPLVLDPMDPDFFPAYDFDAVGVVRPGVDAEAAQAALRAFGRRMSERFPFFYPPDFAQAATVEVAAAELRSRLGAPLFLLLGATATLLLLAAVNAGNMVLARVLERTRELAVRRALGASRGAVARQLALESAALCALGTAVGALLASPGARLLAGLWSADAPVARSGWSSPTVLLFLLAAGGLTWLAIAGASIVHFLAADRRGVRANVAAGAGGRAGVLVGVQSALATLLLAGAVLLVASVSELRGIPLGFHPENVSAFRLAAPSDLLRDAERLRDVQEQVAARVGRLPGVEAVGLASRAPLGGLPARTPVNAEDRPVLVAEAPRVARYAVDPGFFGTLGISAREGRLFDERDRTGDLRSVVVNRALAEALWPGADPIGRRISLDPHAFGVFSDRVVGVIDDVRSEELIGAPGPAVYLPLSRQLERETTLLVRGGPELATLAAEVQRVVAEVDGAVAVGAARSLPRIVRGAYGTAWVVMGLLALLALLATLLAALGIHAALSHDFAARRREIAVRMALGAGRGTVVGGVLAKGLAAAGAGVLAGLLLALLSGRAIESLLFGVSAGDPRAFAAAAVTVLAAALAAAALPVLGASGVPPAEVLREE